MHGGQTVVSDWRTLLAEPAPPGAHGVIRPSRTDATRLRHDDGPAYVAIGENLAWYDGRGTFAYDEWLDRLAAQGATYVRLWMPSWAFGLEWIERDSHGSVISSSLGDYGDRLDRAWQLDHVMQAAAERGIAVMLCLQNHGPFSLNSNTEWRDNPYNVANGGPLDSPREFFTDTEARELFRRRLRYVVARWGHAANLLAWELWNEVDLVEQPRRTELLAWHSEMAATIHQLDALDHMITTSVSGSAAIVDLITGWDPFAGLWALDGIDLAQLHFYGTGDLHFDPSAILPPLMRRLAARTGKPTLLAEAGIDFRGPAETLAADPESIGFHDILWTGLLTGGIGTGMSWWWDNLVDPQDLYDHFGALTRFTHGVAFDRERFRSVDGEAVALGIPLRALALVGDDTALVWIKNADHRWWAPDASAVTGAELELTGLADGHWKLRWMDPYSPGEADGGLAWAGAGTLRVAVPTFSRDVALRLERGV